jgi:hypothetical protein
MRIVYLIISLALTCGPINAAEHSNAPAQRAIATSIIKSTGKEAKTHFVFSRQGRTYGLWVPRDTSIAPQSKPNTVVVVGEVKNAVILVDTYPSIAGGMGFCQAGEEQFIRIISFAAKAPAETWRLKIASCRENLDLASPGVEWLAEPATLNLHWLSGPNGSSEHKLLKIQTDGRVLQMLPPPSSDRATKPPINLKPST